MERTTLSNVLSRETTERWRNERRTGSFKTFLAVFGMNLVHRFPNTDDIDIETIDKDDIERIAEFSVGCSIIAEETWEKFTERRTDRERRERERKAA